MGNMGGGSGEIPEGEMQSMEDGEASGLLGIFYISTDKSTVIQPIDDIASPNGIIGTPDGKTLYVGDNGDSKIWSYTINSDGTLSDKTLFAESITDGMAMDELGNVYVTDGDVKIYSPEGTLLETIDKPEGVSNVEFCGKDRTTLFITYHSDVYTLKMAVKGASTTLDLAIGE